MSDVEFYEEAPQRMFRPGATRDEEKLPAMSRLLMKIGIVKTPQAASYVLISMSLIFFIAAALVFYVAVFHGSLVPTPQPPHMLGNIGGVRGHFVPPPTTINGSLN